MIHTDSAIFEIQVFSGQTAELADSHASFQKYHELIVVFAVGIVFLNEIHPDSQVFLGECNSRYRIIDYYICQFENKRILSDSILIIGHLKCGLDNTSHTADGTKASAILLQLCKPLFRIRYFDSADFAVAEIFFFDQIQNKPIANLCIVAHTFLQTDVLLQ